MHHVAIDLGSIKSQICVRTKNGEIVKEGTVPTAGLPAWLVGLPPSRVVMETCSESFAIGAAGRDAGHDVRVVPATLVRQLGVGARGIKTDKRDAEALSLASCRVELPSVYVRSVESRDLLARVSMRDALVAARTQLINAVRGWLRMELVRVRGTAAHFPKNVRAALLGAPTGIPEQVEGLLKSIEALNTQIAEADTRLKQIAEEHEPCRRLMTTPGVGPVTATTFVALVDDPRRFPTATDLESYLGLTPGEKSSSKRVRRTGITKAGPARARHVLTQAALVMLRTRPFDPASVWATDVRGRRGKQIGIIALARKLAGVLWAMWRTETNYQPGRAAAPKLAAAQTGQ